MMLRFRAAASSASLRCGSQPARSVLLGVTPRRCLSMTPTHTAIRNLSSRGGRFSNTKKAKRVEVLEREAEAPSQQQQQGSPFGFGQQQQGQQQQFGAAPSSTSFPSYVRDREKEQEQHSSQWDALGFGVVEHMRKVYGTLAVGIGIAAGASMFTMATPLIGVHPLIPGLGAMIPLMGIMYTSNHTHSPALRAGMFAAFTGLSGMSLAPMMWLALKISPAIVPQALLITTGLFGAMTGLSLMAKPGSMLRLGVPLGGGLLMLMACGVATMCARSAARACATAAPPVLFFSELRASCVCAMRRRRFVPVTSAWYPLLHNVYLYGGLGLFTLYIAYDTQKMIDEYEMGIDDHIKHATDLFIDFKIVFSRVLQLLMMSRGDD